MAVFETLCWGYGLIEGPRVDPEGNLYFADVPRGGVYRRAPDGQVSVAIPKRRGVGGIALHRDGGLVVGGRDIVHVRDGQTRVLFAPENTGFNDLFPDPQGRVLCGTLRTNPFASGPRVDGECWRIDAEGRATELYGGISLTNGIGLSPDARVIYHADTARNAVWIHELDGDGRVGDGRFLHRADDFFPDGLAIDEAGTVWVADVEAGCVRAFSPAGEETGRLDVPAKMVTSLCFGGDDRRDLYVVTADNAEDPSREGTVFRARADVPGLAVSMVTI